MRGSNEDVSKTHASEAIDKRTIGKGRGASGELSGSTAKVPSPWAISKLLEPHSERSTLKDLFPPLPKFSYSIVFPETLATPISKPGTGCPELIHDLRSRSCLWSGCFARQEWLSSQWSSPSLTNSSCSCTNMCSIPTRLSLHLQNDFYGHVHSEFHFGKVFFCTSRNQQSRDWQPESPQGAMEGIHILKPHRPGSNLGSTAHCGGSLRTSGSSFPTRI